MNAIPKSTKTIEDLKFRANLQAAVITDCPDCRGMQLGEKQYYRLTSLPEYIGIATMVGSYGRVPYTKRHYMIALTTPFDHTFEKVIVQIATTDQS